MGKENKIIGNDGEDAAAGYLRSKGWKILDRNFRSQQGEIDIIAKDKDVLVFVEVKNYSCRNYYPPALAITKDKKRCIIHAARLFIHRRNIKDINCRFDVVTILRDGDGGSKFEHYKAAFGIN